MSCTDHEQWIQILYKDNPHAAWCLNMLDKLWYSWIYILVYNQSICDQICENKSNSLFKVLILAFHNFWNLLVNFLGILSVNSCKEERHAVRPNFNKTACLDSKLLITKLMQLERLSDLFPHNYSCYSITIYH